MTLTAMIDQRVLKTVKYLGPGSSANAETF